MATQLWTTHSGFLSNDKLSRRIQKAAQPLFRFRQFVTVKEAMGKHQGENVNFLRAQNVGTYGGEVAETSTMPETTSSFTQGTLTLKEYGNALPFTSKLSDLTEYDLESLVRGGLMDDMVKVLDGVVEREFNNTQLRYVGTTTAGGAVTTNGTASATNTSVLNTYHTRKIINELKKRHVPGLPKLGGDYVAICSVEAAENMRTALESVNQYTETGYKNIVNGEIGRYYGIRFVEDTFASRNTFNATNRTATAKTWTGTQSLDAYFFGDGTVMEAVAVPEEIRMKIPDDYGRGRGLAWYGLLGYKIIWAAEGDSRIVKWDSA